MDTGTIFVGIIFGGIGFAAFVYGKKQARWTTMGIGIALMAYPYLVSNPILQWVIGAALTVALFIFK